MNKEMKTIEYGDDKIYVKSASGYHDGYYWDMSATVVYKDVEYSIQDAGSGSGYVPTYSSISVDGPCKLCSIMQLCESEELTEYDDWDYIERTILELMSCFEEYHCKKSYELIEGDHFWEEEIHVDGEKIDNEEEEA